VEILLVKHWRKQRRSIYAARRFLPWVSPVVESAMIWDGENPCLLMGKWLVVLSGQARRPRFL
jgi:hypothetical protein